MTQIIDGVLIEWGEQLFYRPVHSMASKRTVAGSILSPSIHRPASKSRADRVRQKLILTTKKVPEVMVKISGGGKGMSQIKAHLDYISRNGNVELENEDGDPIRGKEAVRDLRDEWKNGQYGIPDEGTKREAFNIVLSMPPGTDRQSVKRAAREFACAQFSENHKYIFAAHDDEKHPHIHLCVKALGFDGTRLNPRKADLQFWRELFAEKLLDNGIEANATPRHVRGVIKSRTHQSVIQMERRGLKTISAGGQQRDDSVQLKLGRAQQSVIKSFGGLARALATSTDAQDRKLAVEIVGFVKQIPSLQISSEPTVVTLPHHQATPERSLSSPVSNRSSQEPER
jgi:hypothetical protein